MAPPLDAIAQSIVETMPLGLVAFDDQLRVTLVNEAAAFLVQPGDVLSDALAARVVESKYQDWRSELRRALDAAMPLRFSHVTHRDRDGEERILVLTCGPLRRADAGPAQGGYLLIEDATAGISMEKRLAVSERMAALGKMAARVAHELNNPLDGILRYLGLARRVIEQGQPDNALRYLEQSREGVLRMVGIVTDLLKFSRSPHTSYEDTNIGTIVEEAVKVMSDAAAQARVAFVCSYEDRMPSVRGGGNLFQVFCNLIKNAIDAMPDGGTLTIGSRIAGPHAIIVFEDTGVGLPEDVERIFEPFYTTKPHGKGTGLGLPICRDIVEKYHGRLTAERREPSGARFVVQIPLESCGRVGDGPNARGGNIRNDTGARDTNARGSPAA